MKKVETVRKQLESFEGLKQADSGVSWWRSFLNQMDRSRGELSIRSRKQTRPLKSE